MKVPALIAAITASVAALDVKFHALNYDTRVNEWGGCKDWNTMAQDFTVIKQVTDIVRVYSMNYDCTTQILNVAANRGLKVWLGMWSEVQTNDKHDSFGSEMNNLRQLVNSKVMNNDIIVGLQVSSEALYRYYVQGPGNVTGAADRRGINSLVDHLNEARKFLKEDNQFTFPVVITDIMDMYTMFPSLYDDVDVVAVNQFSFWQNISPEDGAHFTFQRWQEIETRAKMAGKDIVLHETGWSTDGENAVVTEASPRAQGVFTTEFLKLAARQNIKAYYFSAFDLTFGHDKIEKNFGIHYANREMKPAIQSINVKKPLIAVRLWAQGNVLKVDRHWNADNTRNEKYGRLYADKPSSGASGVFDNEIWLYDAESKMLYSKSSDACLDTYGDRNSQTVHTWYCSSDNYNQKWAFNNGNIASLNEANQCMDVDLQRQKYDDGKLVVKMYPCNGHPNQLISVVPVTQDPVEISIHGNGVLTEWYNVVSWETQRKWNADCHQWYYDPLTQLIQSKSNTGMCLDAYERKNGGAVHLYYCDANNLNQKWIYNDITGQIHHANHLGYCLDGFGNGSGGVHLWSCGKTNSNQQWGINLVASKK